MQSVLSENKAWKRSHLWIIMKVQNEIFQSSAEIAFFCLLSLANLPRGKKKYAGYINTTRQPYYYYIIEEK